MTVEIFIWGNKAFDVEVEKLAHAVVLQGLLDQIPRVKTKRPDEAGMMHFYQPSPVHMGDCFICGHSQEHQLHHDPAALMKVAMNPEVADDQTNP